eukprot:1598089-Pyramimonas_sp.AAC.1
MHTLAQAVWESWASREWIARLLFAADAAQDRPTVSKSEWASVRGPNSAALACCRRVGWKLGPGVCSLETREGFK